MAYGGGGREGGSKGLLEVQLVVELAVAFEVAEQEQALGAGEVLDWVIQANYFYYLYNIYTPTFCLIHTHWSIYLPRV